MKDRKVKQVMLMCGRVNEEGKVRWIWLMCFLYTYEYGALKPVEVTLRRWRGRGGRITVGWTKPGHSIHGNVTMKFPVQLSYRNKMFKKSYYAYKNLKVNICSLLSNASFWARIKFRLSVNQKHDFYLPNRTEYKRKGLWNKNEAW
jgi:hypothetical protein